MPYHIATPADLHQVPVGFALVIFNVYKVGQVVKVTADLACGAPATGI